MPTLITRSSKGSELSHAELDANFKRTISQKTTTYSCLISDNRSVIECVHATIAFTVTLGDAATMATGGTGDYEITIINIGAAVVTVARAGTDTIDGVATSITLGQYDSITLKVISAGTGYMAASKNNDTLKVKVIDIGAWNMDSTSSVAIAHGLTLSKIRSAEAMIIIDAGGLLSSIYGRGADVDGYFQIAPTYITLVRRTGGSYDSTTYDDAISNRGYITIWYVD